ncbi:hypothetical protein V6N11_060619 [Hibiscus sabdariffa]|uniref:Uncharacterized protein n=1 Tax=Hibiscus sabdariffa TaxID=183260 RepID=A0ABR2QQW3_9ROSI
MDYNSRSHKLSNLNKTGLLSAETYTPSRLCVLGLRIGSADRFGPGFGALLVQCLLEEYADLIALPVVFSLPAEMGASAERGFMMIEKVSEICILMMVRPRGGPRRGDQAQGHVAGGNVEHGNEENLPLPPPGGGEANTTIVRMHVVAPPQGAGNGLPLERLRSLGGIEFRGLSPERSEA